MGLLLSFVMTVVLIVVAVGLGWIIIKISEDMMAILTACVIFAMAWMIVHSIFLDPVMFYIVMNFL